MKGDRPSPRQAKAAELIVQNLAEGKNVPVYEVLKSVGYGTGLQHNPQRVLNSEGFKSALEEMGFTQDNAQRVVAEILLDGEKGASDRLKAADMIFKFFGSYAPEKSQNVNVNIKANPKDMTKYESLKAEYEEKLRQAYLEE